MDEQEPDEARVRAAHQDGMAAATTILLAYPAHAGHRSPDAMKEELSTFQRVSRHEFDQLAARHGLEYAVGSLITGLTAIGTLTIDMLAASQGKTRTALLDMVTIGQMMQQEDIREDNGGTT